MIRSFITIALALVALPAQAGTLEHPEWNNTKLRGALAAADIVIVRARGGAPGKWVHRWLELYPKEARWVSRDLATDPDGLGTEPNSVRWGEGSTQGAGLDWSAWSEKLVATRFIALPREAPVPHDRLVMEVVIRSGGETTAWSWAYAHPSRPSKALAALLKDTVSSLLSDGRAQGELALECRGPGKTPSVTNRGTASAKLKDPAHQGSILELGPGQTVKVEGAKSPWNLPVENFSPTVLVGRGC